MVRMFSAISTEFLLLQILSLLCLLSLTIFDQSPLLDTLQVISGNVLCCLSNCYLYIFYSEISSMSGSTCLEHVYKSKAATVSLDSSLVR